MKHELQTEKKATPLPEVSEDDEDDDDDCPKEKKAHHSDPAPESGFKASIDQNGSFDCQILGRSAEGITAQEFRDLFLSIVKELRPPKQEVKTDLRECQ